MPDLNSIRAHLPPPLMTSEPGSFAQHTILERKPSIIRQVIEDNDYPQEIVRDLQAFREEIATGFMQPLSEDRSDVAPWNAALAQQPGQTWQDAVWFFAETFFYRRLLEAVRYFQPGPWEAQDPFAKQKRAHDRVAVSQLASSWGRLADAEPEMTFEVLLHSCLWGNRADLSYQAVLSRSRGGLAASEERRHLLIDHTDTARYLLACGLRRVAFVNDNSGMELLCDLALADFLLVQERAQEVVFHLKDHPLFVSDAMDQDVLALIGLLQADGDDAMAALSTRLGEHLAASRLLLKDDSPGEDRPQGFWTSCHPFPDLPRRLLRELRAAELVILKGDANYRRLLSDRHWPHTVRLEDAARYFPAPFLTLRTLKSELMVGLLPGQAEALATEDPDWLINGKRGIIQFVAGRVAEQGM